MIFNFGDDNSLTIQDGAGKSINMNSTVNFYTADGILDKNKKTITLTSGAGDFIAVSNLKTIDGAAAGTIEILGNNKANSIVAGASGSTLDGGKSKDTLVGGSGADVFIYANRSGKDVIENYGAGDRISLGSDVTIKDVKIKKDKVVMKFKGGSLTVNDTTTFTLDDDGDDAFIFQAGDGKGVVTDYASGELLQILDKRGDEGNFKKATFKDNTLTLAINGGGKVILSGVNTSTDFNINGNTHHVEGNSLSK